MGESFLPVAIHLPVRGQETPCVLEYSVNSRLQADMEALFETYRPDYGAFVAIDAETGRILSLVSYSNRTPHPENLVLKGDLPSASVFKVVTAAAALSEGQFSANSVVPVQGSYHTLYRRNVFETRANRWTRYITLREAFAKSVNSVFGRIGAVSVGEQGLKQFAERFGFNHAIASDLPFEPGHAQFSGDSFKLAETASGYTQSNTMSPLQGALIAAAIANDGVMMEPFLVQSVRTQSGEPIYTAEPRIATVSVDARTAHEIRTLMDETVQGGTARGPFRPFLKHSPLAQLLEIGGKTGSLTGHHPSGKYDWFVGYARGAGHKLAFAALTIHEKYWKVKSAYLARRAIESYYGAEPILVTYHHGKRKAHFAAVQ